MTKNFPFLSLIALVSVLFVTCSINLIAPISHTGTEKFYLKTAAPFYHGVASGDPLQDAVIIWTRVTPEKEGPIEITWKVSESADFQTVVKKGKFTTHPERDYTVKVDVQGLKAGTKYFYQFSALDKSSPIGQTQTAPTKSEKVKLAIVSCSNYEAGFYNGFNNIGEREDVDAILHLGDYIYEYGPKVYGDASTGRFHLPPYEIIKLEDYRTRYAQYRLEPDFQAIHGKLPFILIWDDHEIANNSFTKGAQNHQRFKEGSYKKRRDAAKKAYYEWMPIREDDEQKLYRKFSFGDLLDIIMLDERLAGRLAPAENYKDEDFYSNERSMLGAEQLKWMEEQLVTGKGKWKLLGNQVIFSELNRDKLYSNSPKNLDAWDGYPQERRRIVNFIEKEKIENVIFVSGDTHSSWAFEVARSAIHYENNNEYAVAVEFGTPSMTSGNLGDRVPLDSVKLIESKYLDATLNPHLKYANLSNKGYLLLSLTANEVKAEWYYVDKVNEPSDKEILGPAFRVKSGVNKLEKIRNFQRTPF